MKKYKIKYQKDINILITEIEAEDDIQAQYLFYMSNSGTDILNIEEVE